MIRPPAGASIPSGVAVPGRASDCLERHGKAIRQAYESSTARRWQLTLEEFATAIERSIVGRFGKIAESVRSVAAYVVTLHLDDLALARSCELGANPAWQHFVTTHRPHLLAVARRCAASAEDAREMADEVYGELYGLSQAGSERRSLFAWYHGRSKLRTWLGAILVRKFTDRARRRHREVPLDERSEETVGAPAPVADPDLADWIRDLRDALRVEIAGLDPTDRFRLAQVYGHGATLAAVAHLTGSHESTVSRRLAKTRKELKKRVIRNLGRKGRSHDQITEAIRAAADAGGFTGLAIFADEAVETEESRKESPPPRSPDEEMRS